MVEKRFANQIKLKTIEHLTHGVAYEVCTLSFLREDSNV